MASTPPVSALHLARAAAALQRATHQLIRALTAQLQNPTEADAERVRALEAERDRLHDELTRLEQAFADAHRWGGSRS